MQDSTEQASDHHAVVRELTELFRDQSKTIENCQERFNVVCENHWFLRRFKEINGQIKNLGQGDVFIVLFDTSQQSKIKRLIAFALRNFAVKKIMRTLNAQGIDNVESYALYPDLPNIRIIYQRQTRAAHYAENQLLNPGLGTISRMINTLLLALFGNSPLIDVVAVVGRKQ